jgi:hypothetical protein
MQKCSTCRQIHPWEMFNKNRSSKSGYQNECRSCNKLHRQQVANNQCVYAIYHRSDIVYIGSGSRHRAKRQGGRTNQEKLEKYLTNNICENIILIEGLSKKEAIEKEYELIQKYTPKFNRYYTQPVVPNRDKFPKILDLLKQGYKPKKIQEITGEALITIYNLKFRLTKAKVF